MAKTYDPNKVAVIIGGFAMSGYADDSRVAVNYDEDAWGLYIGVDGEGTRSKSNNLSATITIHLAQSSDSNDILSGLAAADRLTNTGAVPLLIKDNNGRSIYEATTAWIQKVADSEFKREVGPREWTIRTDKLIAFLGGEA